MEYGKLAENEKAPITVYWPTKPITRQIPYHEFHERSFWDLMQEPSVIYGGDKEMLFAFVPLKSLWVEQQGAVVEVEAIRVDNVEDESRG